MDVSKKVATQQLAWTLGEGRTGWVSVIVPAYNRADLIVETLRSVYVQTYRPIELIVVDDGSHDATVENAKKWTAGLPDDDQFTVRILRQANAGASAARNQGIAKSEGEFIQFLDSDDVLDTAKIARQVRALNDDPTSDFAYGPVAKLENPDRVVYCQSAMSHRRMILKSLVVPTIQTMSALMRREMVERVGRWDAALPQCQDWEYYSRAAVLGSRGVFVQDSRSYYRSHRGGRLSNDSTLDCMARGRLGQIDSVIAHAPHSLKRDAVFAKTVAWQLLIATARFVAMGWQGDETVRYRQAIAVGQGGIARWIAIFILGSKRATGRVLGARLVLILPWLFYRFVGLKSRVIRSRGTSST